MNQGLQKIATGRIRSPEYRNLEGLHWKNVGVDVGPTGLHDDDPREWLRSRQGASCRRGRRTSATALGRGCEVKAGKGIRFSSWRGKGGDACDLGSVHLGFFYGPKLHAIFVNFLSRCPRLPMENLKSATEDTSSALNNFHHDPPRNLASTHPVASGLIFRNKKPRSLVSLCIGVLGLHFEDIIPDISEISAEIPAEIKLVLLGIARRRQLLNDNVLFALAETLWEILDISGSDVTDTCLLKISQICTNLRAVDISRCDKITVAGVTDLFNNCRSLATLRCGGSPRSDFTARRCLDLLKPNLNFVDGESWEELEIMDIGSIAQSLRWLVWPTIDDDSSTSMATECARICVNPQGSVGFRGLRIPVEAVHSVALDHEVIRDIDPKTWAISGAAHARKFVDSSVVVEDTGPELSMAEKFRLAFVDRDARLAPKRAKNERQNRRRAEKELLMTSTRLKSLVLASQATKFLFNRS